MINSSPYIAKYFFYNKSEYSSIGYPCLNFVLSASTHIDTF